MSDAAETMMNNTGHEWNDIERLALQAPETELRAFLQRQHPADIADELFDLPDPVVERVFLCLDTDTAADVLGEMDHMRAAEVVPGIIPAERLSDIVEEMDSDEAADFIGELQDEQASELLELMEDEDSAEVQALLEYDADTAGGVMTLDVASVRAEMTVDQAIDVLRRRKENEEEVHALYVVDRHNRLVGRMPLRELAIQPGNRKVVDVMDTEVHSVPVDMDQEDVAYMFDQYDLTSAPVVGPDNTLLGRVTVDDMIDVITEEGSEDMLMLAGASMDEFSTISATTVARLRMPWLFFTMGAGLLATMVIHVGEDAVESAELFGAMAPFIPVIMGLGGNTGIQSSTIVTRGLAMRSVKLEDMWTVIWRELRVGLVLGLMFGLLLGLAAVGMEYVTQRQGFGPMLGVIVGLSLALTIPLSCLLGSVFPMSVGRFGIDPAVAAGPFVVMSNDFLSLIVYFTLTALLASLF